MGYANPMTIRGGEWFASECAKAGVDGVICVDIPPEEDPELGPLLRSAGIDLIRLATPTTDEARLAGGARWRIGLPLLCVGRRHHRPAAGRCKRASTRRWRGSRRIQTCPSRSASASARLNRPPTCARVADGVVVGSALVELVAEAWRQRRWPLAEYVRKLIRSHQLNRDSPTACP